MPSHAVVLASAYFLDTFYLKKEVIFWGQNFKTGEANTRDREQLKKGIIFWGQNFETGKANARDRGTIASPISNVRKCSD